MSSLPWSPSRMCSWFAIAAIFWPCLAADGCGQRNSRGDQDWRRDPYTQHELDSMRALGYEFIGELDWGGGHTTADIMATMPGVELRSLETKHFKIASALRKREYPRDSETKDKLDAELDALRQVLPNMPKRVRELDPWLLVHLYAHRMESLYADFSERLGVTADNFPRHSGGAMSTLAWGKGPYLGRPEKFTLLLLESEAQMVRYMQTYLDRAERKPVRHHYENTEGFGYIVAAECHRGVLRDESHMHANVVFGVVQNLLDGYRNLDLEGMPVWFREGLAHWYRRNVDARRNNFTNFDEEVSDKYEAWEWYGKVHSRVKFDIDPPAVELYRWDDVTKLDVNQHAFMWSRVDYIMTLEPTKFAAFVNHCKEFPLFNRGYTPEQTMRWYDVAYKKAFGFDAATFDDNWRTFVLGNYHNKR